MVELDLVPMSSGFRMSIMTLTQTGKVFGQAIRKYWRNFDPERLHPDYAGIRSKVGAGSAASDFIISSPEHNGIPGLINLLGIESPGLTASLAIADAVFEKLNINSMRDT